jgi:MFS family permease
MLANRRWDRLLSDLPLQFSALLMDTTTSSLLLISPWFALERFGVQIHEWGLIVAAGTTCYAIGCLLVGRLADRFGSRMLVILGAAFCALIQTRIASAPSRDWLAAYIVLDAFGRSFFWSPIQAWLGRGRSRAELTRTFGTFNLFWTIGFMTGPLVGGLLFQKGAEYAYTFNAICCAIIVLLAIVSRTDNDPNRTGASDGLEVLIEAPHLIAKPAYRLIDDRLLIASWIANSANWFMLSCVRSLLQYFAPTIHVDKSAQSVILSLTSFAQLLTFIVLSRTDAWHYQLRPILLAQGVAIVGMLMVFGATGPWLLAAGLCFTGMCGGVSYTASLFYSTHGRTDAGKKTGIHEGLLAIGALLGPLLGGALGARWSPAAPFLLCAVVTGLAMFAEWLVTERATRGRGDGETRGNG